MNYVKIARLDRDQARACQTTIFLECNRSDASKSFLQWISRKKKAKIPRKVPRRFRKRCVGEIKFINEVSFYNSDTKPDEIER